MRHFEFTQNQIASGRIVLRKMMPSILNNYTVPRTFASSQREGCFQHRTIRTVAIAGLGHRQHSNSLCDPQALSSNHERVR
jgi:hypothetical protein